MSSWLSCFTDRTFLLLYMHRFLFCAASAAVSTFEYSWLLRHGVSLPVIFLYVGGYFLFSGLAALFATTILRRVGIVFLFALAMGLKVIAALMVSQIEWSVALALSSVLFSGATCGLYYSVADVLEALYVHDDTRRGRQLTLGMAFMTLGEAIGAVASGLILSHHGFLVIAVAAAVVYAGSLWGVVLLPKLSQTADGALSSQATLRFLDSEGFRPFWLLFFGEQLVILAQLFVPLYIFIALGSFRSTGFVIGGATTLQVLFLGLMGHVMDRHGHRLGLRYASWLHALSYIAYFFVPLTAGRALLIGGAGNISRSLLNGAYMVRIHTLLRKTPHLPMLLFGSAYQVTLCAWEVLVMAILAGITQIVKENTIPLLLLGGMIGAVMQNMLFPAMATKK